MAFFTSHLAPSFLFSTDPALLDIPAVHDYISTRSYWGQGTPFSVVERGIKNSLFIGVYDISIPGETKQVGGGRWITDYATFAYMSDVYIENEFQGRGLGRWLVKCLMELPQIQGLRRLMLITGGAERMYEKHAGFRVAKQVEEGGYVYMEKVVSNEELYGKKKAEG